MNLLGVKELRKRLTSMAKKPKKVNVNVGYTQSYAVKVHEDLDAFHAVGAAKYLEGPARELRHHLGFLIAETYKKTGDIVKALLAAGLFLQRVSQQWVPVDTGALKASAFTRRED